MPCQRRAQPGTAHGPFQECPGRSEGPTYLAAHAERDRGSAHAGRSSACPRSLKGLEGIPEDSAPLASRLRDGNDVHRTSRVPIGRSVTLTSEAASLQPNGQPKQATQYGRDNLSTIIPTFAKPSGDATLGSLLLIRCPNRKIKKPVMPSMQSPRGDRRRL